MPQSRIKYQVQDVTIPIGQNQKEVKVVLDANFEKCVGFGVPATLDTTKPIHTTAFNFAIVDGLDSIQDKTPGADILYTPSVPVSDRYKKADFQAKGRTVTLKLDTNGANVSGSDFTVSFVFQLQN